MNGLKPLLPFPTDDLATCIADIWVSILPPEKHSSYPSLPSPGTPMLAGWLLGLSLKGTSAHPHLPVSTPPNSSLAHKAQWGGSTSRLFLSCHTPSPCALPNMPCSEETCIFLPLGFCTHTLLCLRYALFLSNSSFFPRPNSSTKYINPLVRNDCPPLWALISMAVCTCI